MSTTITSGTPALIAREAGIMTVTLNRPEKLNALTTELIDALHAAVLEARDDPDIRAIIMTGNGRGFSAGADMGVAAADLTRDVRSVLNHHYHPLITAMRQTEKPIVAAVNGVAAGAGMSLSLAADFRVAAESARFIMAFVRRGLVPDAGSTFFLPRLVGIAKAAELAMLGDEVNAAEALRIGLVHRVVPDAELGAATRELAERLARGPKSIGLAKRALNLSLASDLVTQLNHEEDLQAIAVASADSREGVLAFVEKRPARFTGR